MSDTKEALEDIIQIHPNPFSENFTISSNKHDFIDAFEIVNTNGTVVLSRKLRSQGIKLNGFSSGVYWIRFFDKKEIRIGMKKIVKI